MKTGRVIGVLLVCALVAALLYFYYQQNKTRGVAPTVVEVDIGNDCKASPDSVDVQDTHRIKWCNKSNLTNLQIDFDGKSPIPNMSVIPVDCMPHTVKRDAECNSNPHDYNGKCYFPYKVTGAPQCGDPGVHVIP
jgi:hypothetical protein